MDIQRLITMGKLECDFDLNGVVFHMVTPTADEVAKVNDNIDLLAVCIKAVDKEPCGPEDVRAALKPMQGAIVGRLTTRLTDLITEQGALVDNLPKK